MNKLRLWYYKYFGDNKGKLSLGEQLEVARSRNKTLKLECVRKGKCPDCKKKKQIIAEARAGLAINVKCNNCGSKFNITPLGVTRL